MASLYFKYQVLEASDSRAQRNQTAQIRQHAIKAKQTTLQLADQQQSFQHVANLTGAAAHISALVPGGAGEAGLGKVLRLGRDLLAETANSWRERLSQHERLCGTASELSSIASRTTNTAKTFTHALAELALHG